MKARKNVFFFQDLYTSVSTYVAIGLPHCGSIKFFLSQQTAFTYTYIILLYTVMILIVIRLHKTSRHDI